MSSFGVLIACNFLFQRIGRRLNRNTRHEASLNGQGRGGNGGALTLSKKKLNAMFP